MRILRLILVIFSISIAPAMLRAAEAQEGGFNLIVVGDPQPQTEAQITRLERDIIPQIGSIVEQYRATGYPTAILLTGDVVWDTMRFLPRVKAMFESLGVPVYAVIGNHDHNKKHPRNQLRAEADFLSTFGSRNHSFMLGNTLFVTLDNIDYAGRNDYRESVDADQLVWLSQVMEQYPDVEHVAVCMHASATNIRTGELKPYVKPIMALIGDRRIDFITGHRHRHSTVDISSTIVEHSVAQVNGNLWFAPICSDGTPQGVFCIEERGDSWTWQHRVLGKDADYQLVAWDKGVVKESAEYVVVKVIGWDDRWQLCWSEDGVAMGAMEQIEILDPDYMYYVECEADYREKYMRRLRRSAHPHSHYFRLRPSYEGSTIVVTAIDRFGRSYTVEP